MKPSPGHSTFSVAQRLRADAVHLGAEPSSAARERLRSALDRTPARSRRSEVRTSLLRATLVLAAITLSIVLTRAPWSKRLDEDNQTVRISRPAVLKPLLSARPIDAVAYVAGEALLAELDALAVDAVAVADAVLRRLPRPFAPSRQSDARAD